MADLHLREGGNVLAGGCQENGCQALQWNVSLNRYRAALEDLLAHSTSDEYGEAGRLAARRAREALEGPADA